MGRFSVLAAGGVCLLLTSSVALATAQRGDVLVLDGEKLSIQTNPLETFLDSNPDKRPQSDIISTSLWRKYVATWKIREQRLFLIDVEALRQKADADDFDTELYSVMSTVFPGQQQVLATWFTGHVIVPRGDLVEYVHLDYASTFESYTVLTVQRGLPTNKRDMGSEEFLAFRRSQFRAYQETEEYRKQFKELKDPGDTDEEVESFIFKVSAGRYMSLMQNSER